MRKKNKWEDDRFQCAEACAVDDVKDFASVFIEKVLTASPAASPFFMVYREGGVTRRSGTQTLNRRERKPIGSVASQATLHTSSAWWKRR